jgi:hypothetical protein
VHKCCKLYAPASHIHRLLQKPGQREPCLPGLLRLRFCQLGPGLPRLQHRRPFRQNMVVDSVCGRSRRRRQRTVYPSQVLMLVNEQWLQRGGPRWWL